MTYLSKEAEDKLRELLIRLEKPLNFTYGQLVPFSSTQQDAVRAMNLIEELKEILGYKKTEKGPLEQLEIKF